MYSARAFLISAIFLAFPPICVANAAPQSSTPPDSNTIVVEVSGKVPGLTQEQLVAYLAQKMQEESGIDLHFLAEKSGMKPAANRVVWSFKILRVDWAGGSHNGFPSPSHSISYLSAEVKLYLKDAYQMTMDARPSVTGGYNDVALSEMVHNVTRALFVDNKPETH